MMTDDKTAFAPSGCLIDVDRELFFVQYEPNSHTTRLVAKTSGTQEKIQNLVRNRRWKPIMRYARGDSIMRSHYRHYKGCWHIDMTDISNIFMLIDLLDRLEGDIEKTIYKKRKGTDNDSE